MSFVFLREKLWPYRWLLTLCLALLLLESALVLVVPWVGGQIAGGFFASQALSLGTSALVLIAIFAIQALLQIVQRRVLQGAAESLTAGLRSDLYDHLQRLPLPWLDDRRHGDLLSLLTREVDVLSDFVTGPLLEALPRLIVLTGAVILMLQIDIALTVPIIFGVPIFYILLKVMARNIRPLAGEIRDAYAHSMSIADENLSILQGIKAYTREDLEAQRYRQACRITAKKSKS